MNPSVMARKIFVSLCVSPMKAKNLLLASNSKKLLHVYIQGQMDKQLENIMPPDAAFSGA